MKSSASRADLKKALLAPSLQSETERLIDNEQTARHLREVEAESVALICCETLGLEGAEFCRGYIQHWLKAEKEIPNRNAVRIFSAVTSILKAGAVTGGDYDPSSM
jgi:hypothetical protein